MVRMLNIEKIANRGDTCISIEVADEVYGMIAYLTKEQAREVIDTLTTMIERDDKPVMTRSLMYNYKKGAT